jgi:phytanoyl-CoA hydroxylase
MLMPAEIEFFKSQGYLVVNGILSPERVALLKSLAESERARARSASRGEHDVLEKSAYGPEPEVFRLSRVMARHAEFQNVALDPRVSADVRALVGEDAEVCINRHNMMIVKAARVGRQVDWHQDGWNWGHDNIVSLMVFLDDSTPSNGCLEVIPGVHRLGLLPKTDNGAGFGLDLSRPEAQALARQAVPVPIKAGDGLFFHSCLPHFSRANNSEHSRRNLVFAYVSAKEKRTPPGGSPMETLPLPLYCPSALSSTVA